MTGIPRNERPLLTDNLDRCAFHPDRPSDCWCDVPGEDGGPASTIGVCAECAPPTVLLPLTYVPR